MIQRENFRVYCVQGLMECLQLPFPNHLPSLSCLPIPLEKVHQILRPRGLDVDKDAIKWDTYRKPALQAYQQLIPQ